MERMFDFVAENTYNDDWLRVFQLTSEDVSGSVEVGFSLVHSAATALGKKLAEEMLYGDIIGREDDEADEDGDEYEFERKFMVRYHPYNGGWRYAFTDTLRVANPEHFHGVETVVPWDWYRVPVWTGTPLLSVIGGALCRISPGLPWDEWDEIFRTVLRQWLRDLRSVGVDLLQYGRDETRILNSTTSADLRGAFGAGAIADSRRHVRNSLKTRESWMEHVDEIHPKSDLYWIPIRVIGFDYGPKLRDWRLWWAPEFEVFAAEFWKLVDRPRQVMPGSWVEA
ncbi:hypothetical protein COL516b_008614 [Colletotrichum fioriniae]|nr:uncharacterized protein COL516b_008614 [Colletotrichum fioriniae]KAJ0300263.1 hypothetical protein COL516b_008614 [Colletotrichum fioriniae]